MSSIITVYRKLAERIDLPFLLFLIAISPNKVYLKVVALALIFALKPDFGFLFNKKISRFYPFLILLSALQFLVFGRDFSATHMLVFLVGSFYWLICYAYMYQSWLFVNHNSISKINGTLAAFLYLNFAICLFNYFDICVKAGTLFPFLQYEGDYGASTGDYIFGLFGAPSYINAMACTLLAIYFMHRQQPLLFFVATFSALLSFANIVNLVFIAVLIGYGIFAGDNRKRVFIVLNIALCFMMYFFVSPDNYNYIKKTIGLSVTDEKEIMPEVVMAKPGAPAKMPTRVKYVNDSSAAKQQIQMIDRSLLFKRDYDEYPTYYPVDIKSNPGKKIAIMQTLGFLRHTPSAAFVGAGTGNFSSRLAFQFSGRDSSRLFMKLPKYAHGYYFKNNLMVYDYMRQLPTEYHSIKHFPNNFFSQLLGEYGLIGLLLFAVCYVWFFFKRISSKLFFFTLLASAGCYLMLDYMYEFFNVMVIAELLLFIDIKQKEENDAIPL